MRKKLYMLIKQALLSLKENDTPIIKEVNYWNEQLMYISQEQPFELPAVFVEFGVIGWTHQLSGVREADCEIRLHIITDSRVGSWQQAIDALDFADKISQCLTGLNGENISAFQLLQSETDHNFDELQDNIETYSTHITDTVAFKEPTKTKTVKLCIEVKE